VPDINSIRQDYREAVASAVEGKDNLEAWERVRQSLANAIFCAWLNAANKTSDGIPEDELTKMYFDKSDCGAGNEGSQGFQPGNTCAGDGGDYTPKYTDGSKAKDTLLEAFDDKGSNWDDLTGKEKKEARWLDHLRRKESENPEEIKREKEEIAKAEQEADELYWNNRAWIKEQGTDKIAKDIGKRFEELGFTVKISGYEGDSKYISVLSDDDEFIGDVRVSDHPSPVGGGYNVAKGTGHGEALVSIDPKKGIDVDSAIEKVLNEAEETDLVPKREQTSSPEFKSWFGDSKVVDESGEPLVVYHGTNQDFDEFDTLKLGTNTGSYGFLGQGLYFTTEVSDAEKYGSSVMPVYVKSEKLLRLDDDIHKVAEYLPNLLMKDDKTTFKEASDVSKKFQSEAEVKKWKSGDFWEFSYTFDGKTEYGDSRLSDAQVENPKNLITFATRDYLGKNDIPDVDNMGALGNYFDSYSFTKAIIEGGFDGVRSAGTNFGDIGDEIMVFNPTQIKSATGNKGDFDPDNPKITHKRTYAKKDAFDELFEIFDIEPDFEVGVNVEALDNLANRVPMVRSAVDNMESTAMSLAEEVVAAERAGILPYLESTSKGMQSALKNAFWVSDVDHETVVNIQRLLADAIRGVMPDKPLSLPDFISEAKLEGAANLTDARLETIYRTNINTAANEGVMAIMRDPVAQDLYPLVMITEIVDDRSREHHAAMDGYVTTPGEIDRLNLRPPNGYNCRGSLIKMTWDEASDLGLLDDAGKPDMIALRRYNSPEQEGLIASGTYPDEGFKHNRIGK
jgi:hypothetical protein